MSTYPNQTKRPKRLRIALAHCEHWLDERVSLVGAVIGGASLIATISLGVFYPQPDTLAKVLALFALLIMGACSVLLICVACFEWSDKQERMNTHRLRKHLTQVKNERDEARRERDEARKQASTNAFALVGALMGDIETK